MKTVQDMGGSTGTDLIGHRLLLDVCGKTESSGKDIVVLVSTLIYICYFT